MSDEIPERPELGSVVAGVDGSASSGAAVRWAAAEAVCRNRPLHLVHATDTERRVRHVRTERVQTLWERGRELLAETTRDVNGRFPSLSITTELSRQEPVAALRAAAGHRATVVVGERGAGGFSALLLGSVGLGMASHANVPVVVVRADVVRADDSGHRGNHSVTAAVHDASDWERVLLAAAEADAHRVALRLLSVWNVLAEAGSVTTMTDDLDGLAGQRVREVKDLADRVGGIYPGLAVEHQVEGGTSVSGVLVEASGRTDLMVVGKHRGVLGIGSVLGRVAHALVHHARCPVEVVPPGFAAHDDTP